MDVFRRCSTGPGGSTSRSGPAGMESSSASCAARSEAWCEERSEASGCSKVRCEACSEAQREERSEAGGRSKVRCEACSEDQCEEHLELGGCSKARSEACLVAKGLCSEACRVCRERGTADVQLLFEMR